MRIEIYKYMQQYGWKSQCQIKEGNSLYCYINIKYNSYNSCYYHLGFWSPLKDDGIYCEWKHILRLLVWVVGYINVLTLQNAINLYTLLNFLIHFIIPPKIKFWVTVLQVLKMLVTSYKNSHYLSLKLNFQIDFNITRAIVRRK